ncbi:MAG TPA: aromatic amino acid ammonia-lyase [Jiangellaceae bacterium]
MSELNAASNGRPTIVINGAQLHCDDVAPFATGRYDLGLQAEALARAEAAWRLMNEVAAQQPVYGRTTGVGANKSDVVRSEALGGHGTRLLRSHVVGVGELLSDEHVRALLMIRANQLAVGRSGAHPRLLKGLIDAVNSGALPAVHRVGSIGTGDLTALAEVGLTLAGERPWRTNAAPVVPFDEGDALAFMSSNAATLAEAAMATVELRQLLRASHAVAALSHVAMSGSPEAYVAQVHSTRSHRGQVECAAEMERLLGLHHARTPGRSIQDPYGLRAFPQVQGPALDAARDLEEILAIEINAGSENPMISPDDGKIYHHGHFHTAYVAVGLDRLRAAVHHVAQLSAARLGQLMKPAQTGLSAFLATGASGSSGAMILEYVAQDALAELRHSAFPVTSGTAIISLGVEDHASFATQAARQAVRAAGAYRLVLACELVAAIRAVRMRELRLEGLPLQAAFAQVAVVLEHSLADRDLSEDIAHAAAALDTTVVNSIINP